MSASVVGYKDVKLEVDKEGHRTYKVDFLVRTTTVLDGAQVVRNATGLYAVGDYLDDGIGNEDDLYALCIPSKMIKKVDVGGEPGRHWIVTQTFTTKSQDRCNTTEPVDPLVEPLKWSGGFVKYTKQITKDKDGVALKSSSHEPFTGPAMEFDENRSTVAVTMNVGTLPLAQFSSMVDTVNQGTFWGMGSRKVKLSNVRWQQRVQDECFYYYTVTYEFDINDGPHGFDRKVIDQGTKHLAPGGDNTKPGDFIAYKDTNGENTKCLLDGSGSLLTTNTPVEINVAYYPESDFTLLGVPATIPT